MPLLSTYVDEFAKIRVLVVGDIMLDRFEYGRVERISPEAPVPVFKFAYEKKMLGGAGNVAANLAALGCKAMFTGAVGQDDDDLQFLPVLQKGLLRRRGQDCFRAELCRNGVYFFRACGRAYVAGRFLPRGRRSAGDVRDRGIFTDSHMR